MLTKTIPLSIFENIDNFPAVGTVLINCLISIPESPNSPPTRTESLTFVNRFSLVGGLMSFPFEYRGRIKLDANRITDSGFYYADGQSSNVDNHIGPFLNFKADQGYIQFVSDIFSGSVYVRSYILSGSSMKWTDWHSIF